MKLHLFPCPACFLLQIGYTKPTKPADNSNGMVGNTVAVLMTSSKGEAARNIVSSPPPFSVTRTLNTPGGLNAGAGHQESQVRVVFPFSTHLSGQLASLPDHSWSSWFLRHNLNWVWSTYARNGAHKAALWYLGRKAWLHGWWTIASQYATLPSSGQWWQCAKTSQPR